MFKKTLRIIRSDGIARFSSKALAYIVERLVSFNSADWYIVDLSHVNSDIDLGDSKDIEMSFDESVEVMKWLKSLKSEFGWTWNKNEMLAAAELDHLLPLIKVDGVKAGYIKIGLEHAYVTDLQRRIGIPCRSAFIYDTFVLPEFRGRRLASLALIKAMKYLSDKDYILLWCHIPRWNKASINTYIPRGFRPVKYIWNIRIFGINLTNCRPEKLLFKSEEEATRCQYRT